MTRSRKKTTALFITRLFGKLLSVSANKPEKKKNEELVPPRG